MEISNEDAQTLVHILSDFADSGALTEKEIEILNRLRFHIRPWMAMRELSNVTETEVIELSSPTGALSKFGIVVPRILRANLGIAILSEADGKPIFMGPENFFKWRMYKDKD